MIKKYDSITKVDNIDYLVYETLPFDIKKIIYYKSGWGNEYRKAEEEFGRFFEIEETKGRSSATFHPYLVIEDVQGKWHLIVIQYSGNWKIVIEKNNKKDIYLKINLGNDVKINSNLTMPEVYISSGDHEAELYEGEKNRILNINKIKPQLLNFPISYNHWWAYEDKNINETTFLENAKIAADIGIDYCVLDAGWFGPNDNWENIRGDWENVNYQKFPNGLKYLGDSVRSLGLKFGIWIEIEAMGKNAIARNENMQYLAEIDGQQTDLLCFGNQAVVKWAFEKIADLLNVTEAKWLKMDFNIDPGFGCCATHHEHGKDDGLQAHYDGFYNLVEQLQASYPDVIFENCSSGGQRTDAKMISLFDVNFLSDADYIEHKIRCFKNSNNFIPQIKNFHFIPSMTVTDFDSGFRSTDFRAMSANEINYNLVSGMMGLTGISHRLTEYDQCILSTIEKFITEYKTNCLPFLQTGKYDIDDTVESTIITYKSGSKQLSIVMAHKNIFFDHTGIDLLSDDVFPGEIPQKSGKIIISELD